MATVDRIETAYPAWTPSAAGIATDDENDGYVGRHRKPAGRGFSFTRLFYTARHRTT